MVVLATRPRVLVFIVAYQAEQTIGDVLRRIPSEVAEAYDLECLIIDDCSSDGTFDVGARVSGLPFPLTVLFNPVNQGYGGNQKIGYHYAIKNGFDFVALIHGDGQYAPECLPELLAPLRDGTADAVLGSRMLSPGAARRGGMPLYKFVGNKILTVVENRLLRTHLSEFHSGYRVYSVAALKEIPFDLNSKGFHFDTEIIIQLVVARRRIQELPIPTYYGTEICRVNGIGYAWQVVKAVIKARLQEASVFYDPKFDCASASGSNAQYEIKTDFESPHSMTLSRVPKGSRVLDLGCGPGHMAGLLRSRNGCRVTGVDAFPPLPDNVDEFLLHDLNSGLPDVDLRQFDCILMLDVIEHLTAPERFIDDLRRAIAIAPHAKVYVSTGNVGFAIVRLMLLFGQFNYGKRGILDLTHTRLFTFGSLRRLLEQAGFRVLERKGVPAPFPLAVGPGRFGRLLLALNKLAIRLGRRLFSYQMYFVVEPEPSLELLLRRAEEVSRARLARTAGARVD